MGTPIIFPIPKPQRNTVDGAASPVDVAMSSAEPPIAAEPHDMTAERLVRRYHRLLLLVATPVFLLLAGLAVWQGMQSQRSIVTALERRAGADHAALQGLIQGLEEHVIDLRKLAARELISQPRLPDAALREALHPHQAEGRTDGFTLDELPALLQPSTAQILWSDAQSAPDEDTLWWLQSLAAGAELAHARNNALARSYYFGAPRQQVIFYPWLPSSHVLQPLGGATLEDALARWYRYEVVNAGLPDNNASRSPYWTAPYADVGTGQLVVSHAAPVYSGDDFRGVVAADTKLSTVLAALNATPDGPGRWWVITERGEVLAEAPQIESSGAPLASARASERTRLVPQLADRLPPGLDAAQIALALQTPGRSVDVDGHRLVAHKLTSTRWTLLHALPDAQARAIALPGLLPFALIAAALLAMFWYGQTLLRQRLLDPALNVMGYLQARSQDENAPEPQLGHRWQPWIDVITRTFRAEREARERERRSEAFKSAVVDNAVAAILSADVQGHILEFNPAAETLFGYSREEVLGKRVADVIVPPRFRAAHEADLKRMREGGPIRNQGRHPELQAMRKNGSEFPVEMVVWRTEIGGAIHFTAWLTDLSERRNAAQQIEHQREALRQSEKLTAMGSLLAGVAHELNNPLAIVLGRANLLEEKCEQLPELKADAQRIREAAERCGRIVRTFLNMARSKPSQRAAVSLNDLARAAADMLGYTYRSHDIELEMALDPQLPLAMADADQIGQVVLNLMVNAQQALSARNPPRKVWLSTGVETRREDREPRVWLRVVDNGAGAPEGMREKIFEPFFTTKPEGIGTGLGLAVSRSLAREHGGDLLLEAPREGFGASFRLSLPLSGEAQAPLTGPAPLAEAEPASEARILVVDDEEEIAALVRAMLESAGHEVSTAESGAVALELLAMARFDAIVSDLRMPDMDGAQLWREVVAHHPQLARRMLFVTGDTLSPGARQFLADARCPSLDKPFSKPDLLAKVADLLA
jgi:PAS domain S-box-containing protein